MSLIGCFPSGKQQADHLAGIFIMTTGNAIRALSLLAAAMALAPLGARAETCRTVGSAQYFDAMHYCVSSFLPPSSKWQYGPENLVSMENGNHLAWCEGVKGPGIGEAITLRIDNGAPFRRLIIANGYGKTEKSYFENARVRLFHVTTDTGLSTSVLVPDQPQPILLPLPDVGAFGWVRLEIGDVYSGSRYQDTCIDFVSPDFEYEEQLLNRNPPPQPVAPEPPAAEPSREDPFGDDPFGDLGMPDPDELRLPGQ
jgi:hypothetical protein